MSKDALMDIRQVADYLRINEATVYNWAQEGKMPGIKLGRVWRFRPDDIESWLDENMRGTKIVASSDAKNASATE